MICIRRQTGRQIRNYIRRQSEMPFTYDEVGASRGGEFPAGYDVKRHRVRLGTGRDTFDAARDAVKCWAMLPPELADVWMPGTPIEPGRTVGIRFNLYGLDLWCASRIIYVLDESHDDVSRFGFAYGTLPDHIARGEGRYLVEWDHRTDDVFYEIASFARPRFLPLRILPFMMRREQTRLHRASGLRMQKLVREMNRLGEELLK